MYPSDNDGWLAPNYWLGLGGKFPHLPSWVGGWIEYGNPDGTNTHWLTGNFYGSLGRYTGSPGVYKCPADRSLTTLGGRQHPRVRSYQMNAALGDVGGLSSDVAIIYRKESQLGRPNPSEHFVFIESHPDDIDDGMFDYSPPGQGWFTAPGLHHGAGTVISFADGHVTVHHWKDPRTRIAVSGIRREAMLALATDNRDVHWLIRRGTHSRAYESTWLPDP